ncbi:hypothetical protein VP01_2687g1 [Puccinia sorghi]|uniref:Uncharacterized protein n=1 Tax=Puccinia sorghi TaxID=27349 RepID=A0A0L6V3S9_9BASI|nr:hypothetical protein VP01_2687g1 [Puccinia sorghi]
MKDYVLITIRTDDMVWIVLCLHWGIGTKDMPGLGNLFCLHQDWSRGWIMSRKVLSQPGLEWQTNHNRGSFGFSRNGMGVRTNYKGKYFIGVFSLCKGEILPYKGYWNSVFGKVVEGNNYVKRKKEGRSKVARKETPRVGWPGTGQSEDFIGGQKANHRMLFRWQNNSSGSSPVEIITLQFKRRGACPNPPGSSFWLLFNSSSCRRILIITSRESYIINNIVTFSSLTRIKLVSGKVTIHHKLSGQSRHLTGKPLLWRGALGRLFYFKFWDVFFMIFKGFYYFYNRGKASKMTINRKTQRVLQAGVFKVPSGAKYWVTGNCPYTKGPEFTWISLDGCTLVGITEGERDTLLSLLRGLWEELMELVRFVGLYWHSVECLPHAVACCTMLPWNILGASKGPLGFIFNLVLFRKKHVELLWKVLQVSGVVRDTCKLLYFESSFHPSLFLVMIKVVKGQSYVYIVLGSEPRLIYTYISLVQ